MKNKLILILLTVFVVGSIASITAFNSIQEDKADAVGKAKKDTIIYHISMSGTESYSYNAKNMMGHLGDKDKKALGDKKIDVVSESGKTLTGKTLSDGSFRINGVPDGEYITVSFAGDKNYNPTERYFYVETYSPCKYFC